MWGCVIMVLMKTKKWHVFLGEELEKREDIVEQDGANVGELATAL